MLGLARGLRLLSFAPMPTALAQTPRTLHCAFPCNHCRKNNEKLWLIESMLADSLVCYLDIEGFFESVAAGRIL